MHAVGELEMETHISFPPVKRCNREKKPKKPPNKKNPHTNTQHIHKTKTEATLLLQQRGRQFQQQKIAHNPPTQRNPATQKKR